MSTVLWPARPIPARTITAIKVEFSAELEQMAADAAFRTWRHEQRTLNLWGSAWMRS